MKFDSDVFDIRVANVVLSQVTRGIVVTKKRGG